MGLQQPITKLPLIASMIDGMLSSAQEQYQALLKARPKPHVLDDYTVGRVVTVLTEQQESLGLYAEQTSFQGEALGNFPQAFTHLALISAAFNLDRALGEK